MQLQADNPDVQFVVPESGGTTFVDTMVIPYTTQHQDWPPKWINYLYDRANYAKLVAFVQYIPVLSDMTEELEKIDPDSAKNPLINPPEDMLAKVEGLARADRRATAAVQHGIRRGHRRLNRWQA